MQLPKHIEPMLAEIGTDIDGELRCVGRVGAGISETQRRELLLAGPAGKPLMDVCMTGCWAQPGSFGTVSYLERTNSGNLRAPSFAGLASGDGV